jgi:large subunit ribosomal protein L20
MARVKGGTIHAARRKKVLKQAKGYFGSKHRLYKTSKEQVMHSLSYAYRDRRQVKRDMRKLWITRINAACRMNDISYSKFINGLTKAGVSINRKMLSEIAINDETAFAGLVEIAKTGEVKTSQKKEVKAAPKKEIKAEETETTDLNSKTVAELRELAKAANIEGSATMKKAELITALK